MPALVIDPAEAALPSHLIPPLPGAPLAVWGAYRDAARAAGVYRAAKVAFPEEVRRCLPPPVRPALSPSALPAIVRKPPPPIPATREERIRALKRSAAARSSIQFIIAACSAFYGVARADILSGCKKAHFVRARQVGMYLAKKHTSRSFPEIGRRFGGRDHTTAIHAYRKISAEIEIRPSLRAEVEEIERAVAGDLETAEGLSQ